MADVAELITREALITRVAELAHQLDVDYAGRQPVMVGVLHGAIPFLADLVRSMQIDLEVDFLALSRFGEGGRVRLAMDCEVSLEGRHAVLIEDIVDTGLTLRSLRALIETRDVASLSAVTLVDKSVRRLIDVPLEYRGFEVGDEFLLGYGLDWQGKYRNLESIWAVMDLPKFAEAPPPPKAFSRGGDRLPA